MDARSALLLKAKQRSMNAFHANKKKPDVRKKLIMKKQVLNQTKQSNVATSKSKFIKPNDIRFKIIEKKRGKISDARDKLAELSKQKDARIKLQALKKIKNGNTVSIKKTIKTDAFNNYVKIAPYSAMNAPKTAMKKGALTRTISGAPQKKKTQTKNLQSQQKLALKRTIAGSSRNTPKSKATSSLAERRHLLKNNPNVVTIKNERAREKSFRPKPTQRKLNPWDEHSEIGLQQASYRQQSAGQVYGTSPFVMTPSIHPQSGYGVGVVPQPIFQQVPPHPPTMMQDLSRYMGHNDYFEPRNQFRDSYNMNLEEQPTSLRITAYNNRMVSPKNFDVYDSPRGSRADPLKRFSSDDYGEQRPSPPKKSFRSGAEGSKVMVTNLHSIVTVDDIRELFGCIGPINYARLIRDGIAEISYVKEEDALRAVDVYHNRQLDQQPMSVVLTSKRIGDARNLDQDSGERNERPNTRSALGYAVSTRSSNSQRVLSRSSGQSAYNTAGGSSNRSLPRSAGSDSLSYHSDANFPASLDNYNRASNNASFLKSARGSSDMFIF